MNFQTKELFRLPVLDAGKDLAAGFAAGAIFFLANSMSWARPYQEILLFVVVVFWAFVYGRPLSVIMLPVGASVGLWQVIRIAMADGPPSHSNTFLPVIFLIWLAIVLGASIVGFISRTIFRPFSFGSVKESKRITKV